MLFWELLHFWMGGIINNYLQGLRGVHVCLFFRNLEGAFITYLLRRVHWYLETACITHDSLNMRMCVEVRQA
jgi:hypothetical protein